MIKINVYKISLLFFYFFLFLNGTFFVLDSSSILLNILNIVVILSLYFFNQKYREEINIYVNFKKLRINNILILIFPLVFIIIYFINNYSQEFPFSGDYKLHAENSLNINQFLLSSFFNSIDLKNINSYSFTFLILNFLISNLALTFYFFLLVIFLKINKISLVLIIIFQFLISLISHVDLTYPSGTYFLSLPFNVIAFFTNTSLIESIRYLNFLSPFLWLFIMRPILLGEKITINIFFVTIFLFWQLEIIFLFTSNYNEPFAIISILLAFELAIRNKNIAFVPILVGLATCFKLVNIFFIPVFWILLLPEYLKRRKLVYNFLLYCLFSFPFLYFYQQTRLTGKVDRSLNWDINILNRENINELLFRVSEMFTHAELLCLFFLILSIFLSKLTFNQYYKLVITILSSLIFFFIFFLDVNSSAWIGYLRFYIYFYIIILSLIFFIDFKTNLKLTYIFSLLIIILLFFSNFNKNIEYTFKDDYNKSFFFHYEEPIFLPIKKLIKIYENENNIIKENLIISRPNNYIEPIQDTFKYGNYNYVYDKKLKYNCICENKNIYINTFFSKLNLNRALKDNIPIYYKYFGDVDRSSYNFISESEKKICVASIIKTCSKVYYYRDKENIIGIISSNE